MTVQVMNSDGTASDIGGIYWHPEIMKTAANEPAVRYPASLWTTERKLEEHYKKINDFRIEFGGEPRDLSDVLNIPEYASAPVEVYLDCEDGQPWKHLGLLKRTIPYGGSDSFWNNHT